MDKCCNRVEIQATHWEGCHTDHPDCAAYKAGFRAGLRRAAEIAALEEDAFHKAADQPDYLGSVAKHYAACASGAGTVETAILAEAEK